MKAKKWIFLLILLVVLGGGGFLVWKYVFKEKENQNTGSNGGNSDNPPNNPDGKLSQQELEKYLLEKRLDLQKYFVFNLGKEVKLGKANIGSKNNPYYANNGRDITPSLERHLTKLMKEEKDFIIFQGKYTNETDPEWSEDKLDQKIKNGEEWYIIFDKSQIDNDSCNYFSKWGKFNQTTYFSCIVIAVLADPEVKIFKSKSEALEFIKTDPALEGKV